MFDRHRFAIGILASAALAGCSGGSGSAPAGVPITPSAPIATTAPVAASSKVGLVTVKFRFPVGTKSLAAKRSPQYLSYGTQSIAITLTPAGGGAPIVTSIETSSTSATCAETPGSAATLTCSTGLYAPVGASTLSVTAYDTPQAPGATSNFVGNILGQVSNLPVNVQAGTNTPVVATLSGVPATAVVMFAPAQADGGTAGSTTATVFAYDADQYLIVGPYLTPIGLTLTSSGATFNLGTTSVADSSGSAALTYQPGTGTATVAATIGTSYTSEPAVFSLTAPGAHNYVELNANLFYPFVYDLSTATQLAGGNASQLQTNYLYQTGGTAYNFTLGPKNEVVDTSTLSGNNNNSIEYYAPLSGAQVAALEGMTNDATVPTAVITYTGVPEAPQSTQGSGPLEVTITPDDKILAVFDSSYTAGTGVTGATITYSVGVYQEGTNGNVPPPVTFQLSDGYQSGLFGNEAFQFDQQGNLWVLGNSGLDEYAAAAVANAETSGGTLTPVTQITGSNFNPMNDNPALAFDKAGNIYVELAGFPPTITVYAASVRGSVVPQSDYVESFTPADVSGLSSLAIEPTTQYLVVLGSLTPPGTNNGNQDALLYFPSYKQQGQPAIGATNVMPFRYIVLNGSIEKGISYLH